MYKWKGHTTPLPVKTLPGLFDPTMLRTIVLPSSASIMNFCQPKVHHKFITHLIMHSKCTSPPLQPDPIYFPLDPLQADPIYFLTTKKCSVFGVCYEAIPRQIDFITDGSGETGKGANAMISRRRFFYKNHGLGEKDVIFMLTTVLARTRTI